MILCDIGNTTFDFYKNSTRSKVLIDDYEDINSNDTVYYISVNEKVSQRLKPYSNWIDVGLHVDKSRFYETMGIDRIIACMAVRDGVIIDAGSAITVDIMKDGNFMGGYIALGLEKSASCYMSISSKLHGSYNFEQDFDKIPKNTQDAITYAQLGLLYKDVVSYNLPIYLTGGDAKKLKSVFKFATVDGDLVFKSMLEIIKGADLC